MSRILVPKIERHVFLQLCSALGFNAAHISPKLDNFNLEFPHLTAITVVLMRIL